MATTIHKFIELGFLLVVLEQLPSMQTLSLAGASCHSIPLSLAIGRKCAILRKLVLKSLRYSHRHNNYRLFRISPHFPDSTVTT